MKAVAYYRTSSATNVGDDKDSEKRQRDAVLAYAEKNGIEVVRQFYDAAIKGADSVGDRPGFSDMMAHIAGNGVRMVLVESASRFARDLIVQMTGHAFLKKHGIELVPVDCPQHFMEDTPTAKLIRQVMGAFSEFERNSLVDKLRKARDRKRRDSGRCEGRKPAPPEAILLARRLQAGGASLRQIGVALADAGYTVMVFDKELQRRVPSGVIYKPQSIKSMLRGSGKNVE